MGTYIIKAYQNLDGKIGTKVTEVPGLSLIEALELGKVHYENGDIVQMWNESGLINQSCRTKKNDMKVVAV